MRPRELENAQRLGEGLASYEADVGVLPGVAQSPVRSCLLERLIESDRRNRYIECVRGSQPSPDRTNPNSGLFDPLKASVLYWQRGAIDEAFWMVFLFVHFGKHRRSKWQYAGDVYGRLGTGGLWDWSSVKSDVDGFRQWLAHNSETIRGRLPSHGFGNHRKYESLDGWSEKGTGAAVASYVAWVESAGGHEQLFAQECNEAANGEDAFDRLYQSMSSVTRFGRIARFDCLSLVSRLEMAPIRPGQAYLVGSSGPLKGARLLFDADGDRPSRAVVLDHRLIGLESHLNVGFDCLEDALCNWQKNPSHFTPFRG